MRSSCFYFIFLFLIPPSVSQAQYTIRDRFGRDITTVGITLTDWEGYIANPAIELTVEPNIGSQMIGLTANHARLYFNMPSTASATGPSKFVMASAGNPETVYLSIFPDRDGTAETHYLTLSSGAGTLSIPIHVIDEDQPSRSNDFNIPLDFTHDTRYNFFSNATRTTTVTQAASDWAYFIANMNFDQVTVGSEQTYIWNDNFAGGTWHTNTQAYTGFLIYPYGFDHSSNRSGGAPSNHAFQRIGGVATQLRRSGAYEAEKDGNYNTLGWLNSLPDDEWYIATNLGDVQNDLYSIALHEMGHALAFNGGHTQFGTYKTQGFVNNGDVVSYYGSNLPINSSDHFSNGSLLFDPVSKKGLFGSEYANEVPYGRWLITKTNLLCMKAIGYNLRETSCLKNLTVTDRVLAVGTQNSAYSDGFAAEGGIKAYRWLVLTGSLPNGLSLNSFTGAITGTPTESGNFPLTIQLDDQEHGLINFSLILTINASVPVELAAGPTAILRGQSVVDIDWSTASEINSDYFLVERSSDLKTFTPIGKIAAAGQSQSLRHYQFIDKSPLPNINYYRLRAIDLDGTTELSRTVSVEIKTKKSYRVNQAMTASTLLTIQSETGDAFDYLLWDMTGRLVAKGRGDTYAEAPVSHLAQGIYILVLIRSNAEIERMPIFIGGKN